MAVAHDPAIAVLIALVPAVLIGLANGIGVGIFRVHPLIMTLGTSLIGAGILQVYQRTVIAYLVLSLPVKLVVLWLVGVYRRLWRYAGILEVERLILGGRGVLSEIFERCRGGTISFCVAMRQVPLIR